MDSKLYSKVGNATKWSAITELLSKIVTPVSNMALARILVPEAFGIVATITMITSFADIFTDAGFQKYIIQHQFQNEKERNNSITVAFWTNLAVSLLIWLIIVLFISPIAKLIDAQGAETAVVIASLVLILTAFSSIQTAIYKSTLDFHTLFIVKCVLVAVPFVVTIPLALITRSYWALIIGNLVLQAVNAIVLTVKSPWKPRLYYDFKLLRDMFAFSIWSLIDNILSWLTTWGDTFIVGITLSSYYVGLYKTSMNTVNSIMNIIIGATTSVLLTALSKLQKDDNGFNQMLFRFQHTVAILILPMGAGIYLYRDLVTDILLGSQWGEVTGFIGLWGMMSATAVLFNTYGSCVCIAKGKPKLSVLAQILQLVVLLPVVYLASRQGFEALYTARTLVRIEGILVYILIMKLILYIPVSSMLKELWAPAVCTVLMGGLSLLLQQVSDSFVWSIVSIGLCAAFYFAILALFPKERAEILGMIKRVTPKLKRKA